MTPSTPTLSIVIPAYNEEKRISKTLARMTRYLADQPYTSEVIVVDDGSRDNTLSKIAEFQSIRVIRLLKNSGKGSAIRQGVLEAHGSAILFSDADLSTPIEEVQKCLEALRDGADIAIGSRALEASDIVVRQPWYRDTMGKIFNLFVLTVVMRGIRDTQCGFKCFKADVAKTLFQIARISRFSFDVEILYLARKKGYRIRQIPIQWRNDPASSVHPLRDAFRMLIDLFIIRWTHRHA